jgi:hypothetical protein
VSHQFKEGDLALTIVDDEFIPAYSVVTLNSRATKGEPCFTWDDKPDFAEDDGWFVLHPSSKEAWFYADKELIPLKGDFDPVQQKDREVVA